MAYVKISQIMSFGVENHLITLEVKPGMNTEEFLNEITKLIFEKDNKMYFCEGGYGVVFRPHQGPVKFQLVNGIRSN